MHQNSSTSSPVATSSTGSPFTSPILIAPPLTFTKEGLPIYPPRPTAAHPDPKCQYYVPPAPQFTPSSYASGNFTRPDTPVYYLEMEEEHTFLNRLLPSFRRSRRATRDVLQLGLPTLRDVAFCDRPNLFSRKIRLCCYLFDNTDPHLEYAIEYRDRELKRSTCLDLSYYISTCKPLLTDNQTAELFEMITLNIFQPLPPTCLELYDPHYPIDDELLYFPPHVISRLNTYRMNQQGAQLKTGMYQDDDGNGGGPGGWDMNRDMSRMMQLQPSLLTLEETRWDQLQAIYDVLLKVANNSEADIRIMSKYFNQSFVLGLLDRFDSEQPRERDYLKTILHRIYGNFMSLRPFIRTAINNVFYRLVYETDRYNGAPELLEILGSIINGFALPLKDQHKTFLMRVLLPMHKTTTVLSFLPQLTYCLTQFLEKDPSLATNILDGFISYWPHTSSKKEICFLKELEDLIEKTQPKHLSDRAYTRIFRLIGQCIESPHFQVSERALMVLHSEGAYRLLSANRNLALPPIIESLHVNTYSETQHSQTLQYLSGEGPAWVNGSSTRLYCHWSPTIADVTADVLKKFQEMDPSRYDEAAERFRQRVAVESKSYHDRIIRWRKVVEQAKTSGLLEKYDHESFHVELRKVNRDPPAIVRRERKSNPS